MKCFIEMVQSHFMPILQIILNPLVQALIIFTRINYYVHFAFQFPRDAHPSICRAGPARHSSLTRAKKSQETVSVTSCSCKCKGSQETLI